MMEVRVVSACSRRTGPLQIRRSAILNPMDTEHLAIERLKEVVGKCDQFLPEDEQRHLQSCMTCLTLFVNLTTLLPRSGSTDR
jgi:hypothetical protein